MLGVRCHDRQRHDLGCLWGNPCRLRLNLRLRNPHCRGGRFGDLFLLESQPHVTQHGQARFRVIKHVPWFRAACLDGLHVVLDADDCIRQPVRFFLREPGRAAALQRKHNKLANTLHDFHGARLVQHHQAGFDAAHQRWHAVQSLGWRLRDETLSDRLLDTREVDDALAHDGFGDLLIVGRILRRHLRVNVGQRILRHGETNELLVEPVLDAQQCGRDIENDLFAGNAAAFDDRFEPVDFAIDVAAKLAESQHAERVTDLLQQLELRNEFRRLVHSRADEDVQHVLDPGEIFLDRGGDRLHELDARRG